MAEDKNMVTVDLRRSVGVRVPGGGAGATLYGPGRVQVPRDVARSLGLKPAGKAPKAAATETEPADPYTGFLKSDFEAEAARRGIEVKRTDGASGDLRVEDYRAALEADDKAKA